MLQETNPIRLLIIEDHQIVRDSLIKSISMYDDFFIVGDSGYASHALDLCKELKPDVVLMDVCTENNESGIAAAAIIKEEMSEIKIIIMTGMVELRFIEMSKSAKADSFIYKNIKLEEMVSIIRGTFQGYSTYPISTPMKDKSHFFDLTDREQEILLLICSGQSRKEIAETMHLSESSVKSYISNILSKTGFTSTTKLAVHAISEGYLNPKLKA